MKVLYFEDNMQKYMDIASVLKQLQITDVTWVDNVEEGMDMSLSEFDVILSDMQYPLTKNGNIDEDAGEKMLKQLKALGIDILVIIISSARLCIAGAKCIWYSDSADWEGELMSVLRTLM